MSCTSKVLAAAALAFALGGMSSTARADDQWQADHPRRAQVNSRTANQNRRIRNGVKDGQLTHAQAAQLHEEHQAIRGQERSEAAKNGGHLTKGEQRQINHEENAESHQIDAEKH